MLVARINYSVNPKFLTRLVATAGSISCNYIRVRMSQNDGFRIWKVILFLILEECVPATGLRVGACNIYTRMSAEHRCDTNTTLTQTKIIQLIIISEIFYKTNKENLFILTLKHNYASRTEQ